MVTKEHVPAAINFHFDPLCPLAWRTALWVREARKQRPIDVNWRLFSLDVVNRTAGVTPNFQTDGSGAAERTLALARRQGGNEEIERLYVAMGDAAHGRKESLKDLNVLRAAAERAGLNPDIVDEALADESTINDVLADHEEAVSRYHAFGVPTIAFEGSNVGFYGPIINTPALISGPPGNIERSNVGFYGPIINTVPHGEEAAELWDYTAWALRQPNLFELKRDRAQAKWGPVPAE